MTRRSYWNCEALNHPVPVTTCPAFTEDTVQVRRRLTKTAFFRRGGVRGQTLRRLLDSAAADDVFGDDVADCVVDKAGRYCLVKSSYGDFSSAACDLIRASGIQGDWEHYVNGRRPYVLVFRQRQE